uniref:Uncharacterized protein n=1 Tax=Anguilla anguilla TaxID=7936 RepID=A0A0E9SRJ4_ANGAN
MAPRIDEMPARWSEKIVRSTDARRGLSSSQGWIYSSACTSSGLYSRGG